MRISRLAIATLFALWMVAGANAEEPQADAQAVSEGSAPASAPDASSAPAEAEAPPESPEGEAASGETGDSDPILEAPAEAVDGEPAASDETVEEGAGEEAPVLPPASPDASDLEASAPLAPEGDSIQTGVGYDAEGKRGYVHVVQPGDTLWDIAETYLTTPWVWPSIWKDNPEVSNPHLIYPGDRLWISPAEMRRITVEEAAEYLAGTPPAEEVVEELPPLPPAAPEEEEELVELPVETPVVEPPKGRVVRFSDLESVGLVSVEQDKAAASIIESRNPDRVWLGQPDEVYIGLGEGEVQAGDQFEIYRKENPVYDVDNGRFVGHYVRILGWLEVKDVFPESSLAEIRMSPSEIVRGDRLIAREQPGREVVERLAPGNVDGKVIFMPDHRTVAGSVDYVFLNRGSLHGLDPGTLLEVYRPGFRARDEVRGSRRRVPEDVVATITVVKSSKRSAVAFVSHTNTELEIGDRFRAAR